MNPRILLAIFLMLGVIVLWNGYYYYRYKDVLEAQRIEKQQKATEKKVRRPTEKTQAEGIDISKALPIDPMASPAATADKNEETAISADKNDIIVDTGVALISLSKIGGVISSIKLNDFENDKGKPVELVNHDIDFMPLSLEFATVEATKQINSSEFSTSSPSEIFLTQRKPEAAVDFEFTLDTGFKLKKRFIFNLNSYKVGVEIGLSHTGINVTGSSFGVFWPDLGKDTESSYSYKGPLTLIDDKRMEKKPDEDEAISYEGKVKWAGLSSKYYAIIYIPEEEKSKVTTRMLGDDTYASILQLVSHGENSKNRFSFYAGPKNHAELAKQGNELERVINYGWFNMIAKPLFVLLMWLNSVIGNFGWAIIVLTILIKTLFWPLTHKSYASMQKMQKLQPQMKILQQRYKKDKTKLNEELIALYKKEKVNPMGGCMPMLLQIPVFIALYKVLLESIELKGAPFILWISDLSLKDPYYVTPLLMGASMFLQQKMSPASGDPMQRNMMLAMPVVFTIMFLSFPAGLVIYWLINNLLSIAQQYFIKKKAAA